MKTLLVLLILVVAGRAAETGIFGPIERPGAPGTFSVSAGNLLVSSERDDAGMSHFKFWDLDSDKDNSNGTPISKEQFIECYHLASSVIRKFRRSGKPMNSERQPQSLSISGGIENLTVTIDADVIKENPRLAELLAMLKALSKPR